MTEYEYKGFKISFILFGGIWMIYKDGKRLNYNQEHFDDVYAVYKFIDEHYANANGERYAT